MLTFVRGWMAASVVVCGMLTSVAQEREKVAPAREAPAATRASDRSVDAVLVKCLIKENENEVAVARLAQKRANSKEVQAFAEKMIQEHTACITKLKKLNGDQFTTTNRDTTRDAVRDKKAEVSDHGTDSSTLSTMMRIGDELSKKCLETTLRELEQKEGVEFDHCFMGIQIMNHLKMADTLAVYQNHAGSDLAAALREGEKTTKEHLADAKRIAKDLESGSARTTAK